MHPVKVDSIPHMSHHKGLHEISTPGLGLMETAHFGGTMWTLCL